MPTPDPKLPRAPKTAPELMREAGAVRRIGWLVWAVLLLAVSAILLTTSAPLRRTVTPNFRDAAIWWWRSESIYRTDLSAIHGYLYFPHCAILFTPFALPALLDGPVPEATPPAGVGEATPKVARPYAAGLWYRLSEVAWRAACFAAFVAGFWRLTGLLTRPPGLTTARDELADPSAQVRRAWIFLVGTLFMLGIAWGSARNGQMNMMLGGVLMLAGTDLAARRWWCAAGWLALGVAFKPLAVVMLLLAAALYPRTIPRLAVFGLLALVLPFAHPDPAYVMGQFEECAQKLRSAAQPPLGEYSDLTTVLFELGGLLRRAGIVGSKEALVPSDGMMTAIRGATALGTLALSAIALRRWGPARGSFFVFALAALYVMLMNPRTEGNTYIILGPAAALLAAEAIADRRSLRLILPLAAYCLILGFAREVFKGGQWLRPAASVLFAGWLLASLFSRSELSEAERAAPASPSTTPARK